jgi:ligand-binding SRPBCC domain-containing protein
VVHIELTTAVNAPPAQVFAWALDVGLHSASLAHSAEHIVAGVTTGQMRLGDDVRWRARHFGHWWTMTARVTEYDPPRRFTDVQVAGPFAHWRHAHDFQPTGSGTTVMRDVIDFAAPYGPIGRMVEVLVLARYLRSLIRRRNRHLARIAEGGRPA